jgi:hypothetical protein
MMEECRFGLLPAPEWNGLWKRNEFDSDVSLEEFEHEADDLDNFILEKLDPVLYTRADFFEDRTHYVDITAGYARAFKFDHVLALQQWLKEGHTSAALH